MNIPLSSDDLRLIASNLDAWNAALVVGETEEYKPLADLIHRIPISRPDSFDNKIIGEYVLVDGWVGVEFNGES